MGKIVKEFYSGRFNGIPALYFTLSIQELKNQGDEPWLQGGKNQTST
jgi:hypothetical protein